MFHSLLAILAYYPPREDVNAVDITSPFNYYVPDDISARYRELGVPGSASNSGTDDDDEEEEQDALEGEVPAEQVQHLDDPEHVEMPAARETPPHIKELVDKAQRQHALQKKLRHVQQECGPSCLFLKGEAVPWAFVAAAPLARHAVEMSGTAGTVYSAPMANRADGAPLEPGDDGAPAETSIVCRQPVVSIRVGAIERETGDVFKAKTDYDAYDPPYVGCDSNWRQHKLYRQLTIHTTRLVAGSVAWRVLEASAWWWRDRRMPVSKSTHPICVSSVSLEGPVSFPRALFGDDGLLQVVRIRSLFASHPYFASDAVVDVAALAHTHGDYLTELDLYGADRCENLMPGLASGSFTTLVYANLARTIFSEAGWRAARVGLDVVGAAGTPALPCLEELVLDGCHHLRQLDADILAHMPNLRKLNVFNCTKLRVIRDLAVCCPYLTQLCMNYTHVTVLDFGVVPENGATLKTTNGKPQIAGRPAQASHLQVVDLKNSTFDSLEWLAQTPSLDTLVFSGFDTGNGVALSCLSFTRYVRKINLFCSTVGDLTPLSACTFLEELFLIGLNPPDDQPDALGIDAEPILLAGATASDPRPLQRLRHLEISLYPRLRIDYRSDIHGPPTNISDTAMAVARSLSMLAVSLDSLETLILADCDDFDDLHTLLTLPNGDEHLVGVEAQQKDAASAETQPASTPRHYVARFPHLKVLDVSSTHITEMDSIVRYCPQLEKLNMRHCRHMTVDRVRASLCALVEQQVPETATVGETDDDNEEGGNPQPEMAAPSTCREADACNVQLRHLVELNISLSVAINESRDPEDTWVAPVYHALSRLCPALQRLITSDSFTVFHNKKDWDRLPVFPELTTLRTSIFDVPLKRIQKRGLKNVMPHMFPKLRTFDGSVRSLAAKTLSPFSELSKMTQLAHISASENAFAGAEHVLEQDDCPLRSLTCRNPSDALLTAIGKARTLQTLSVGAFWVEQNQERLEALARANTGITILVV